MSKQGQATLKVNKWFSAGCLQHFSSLIVTNTIFGLPRVVLLQMLKIENLTPSAHVHKLPHLGGTQGDCVKVIVVRGEGIRVEKTSFCLHSVWVKKTSFILQSVNNIHWIPTDWHPICHLQGSCCICCWENKTQRFSLNPARTWLGGRGGGGQVLLFTLEQVVEFYVNRSSFFKDSGWSFFTEYQIIVNNPPVKVNRGKVRRTKFRRNGLIMPLLLSYLETP